jgi:hypothetical protein
MKTQAGSLSMKFNRQPAAPEPGEGGDEHGFNPAAIESKERKKFLPLRAGLSRQNPMKAEVRCF